MSSVTNILLQRSPLETKESKLDSKSSLSFRPVKIEKSSHSLKSRTITPASRNLIYNLLSHYWKKLFKSKVEKCSSTEELKTLYSNWLKDPKSQTKIEASFQENHSDFNAAKSILQIRLELFGTNALSRILVDAILKGDLTIITDLLAHLSPTDAKKLLSKPFYNYEESPLPILPFALAIMHSEKNPHGREVLQLIMFKLEELNYPESCMDYSVFTSLLNGTKEAIPESTFILLINYYANGPKHLFIKMFVANEGNQNLSSKDSIISSLINLGYYYGLKSIAMSFPIEWNFALKKQYYVEMGGLYIQLRGTVQAVDRCCHFIIKQGGIIKDTDCLKKVQEKGFLKTLGALIKISNFTWEHIFTLPLTFEQIECLVEAMLANGENPDYDYEDVPLVCFLALKGHIKLTRQILKKIIRKNLTIQMLQALFLSDSPQEALATVFKGVRSKEMTMGVPGILLPVISTSHLNVEVQRAALDFFDQMTQLKGFQINAEYIYGSSGQWERAESGKSCVVILATFCHQLKLLAKVLPMAFALIKRLINFYPSYNHFVRQFCYHEVHFDEANRLATLANQWPFLKDVKVRKWLTLLPDSIYINEKIKELNATTPYDNYFKMLWMPFLDRVGNDEIIPPRLQNRLESEAVFLRLVNRLEDFRDSLLDTEPLPVLKNIQNVIKELIFGFQDLKDVSTLERCFLVKEKVKALPIQSSNKVDQVAVYIFTNSRTYAHATASLITREGEDLFSFNYIDTAFKLNALPDGSRKAYSNKYVDLTLKDFSDEFLCNLLEEYHLEDKVGLVDRYLDTGVNCSVGLGQIYDIQYFGTCVIASMMSAIEVRLGKKLFLQFKIMFLKRNLEIIRNLILDPNTFDGDLNKVIELFDVENIKGVQTYLKIWYKEGIKVLMDLEQRSIPSDIHDELYDVEE